MGKHSLKFGYEWAHIEADTDIPDTGRGQISFDNLTNFFTGTVTSGKLLVGNPTRKATWTSNAAFVQDDWRISPRFTLNLGLRYSYFSPLREVNNNWANFDPNSPTGLVQQGQPGLPTLWHPNRGDFSPRFGFAYDVNGKGTTVVRGGFSIIYSEFSMIEWQQQNQFQNTSAVALGSNPTGACTVSVPVGSTCAAQPGGTTLGGNMAVKAAKFKATTMCWDPTLPGSSPACAGRPGNCIPDGCGDIVYCRFDVRNHGCRPEPEDSLRHEFQLGGHARLLLQTSR